MCNQRDGQVQRGHTWMYVWTKCMDFVYMLTTKFPDSLKKNERRKKERKKWRTEGMKEEDWRTNKDDSILFWPGRK